MKNNAIVYLGSVNLALAVTSAILSYKSGNISAANWALVTVLWTAIAMLESTRKIND